MSASITVRVPLSVRRRPGRKTIVTPDGQAYAPTYVGQVLSELPQLGTGFNTPNV